VVFGHCWQPPRLNSIYLSSVCVETWCIGGFIPIKVQLEAEKNGSRQNWLEPWLTLQVLTSLEEYCLGKVWTRFCAWSCNEFSRVCPTFTLKWLPCCESFVTLFWMLLTSRSAVEALWWHLDTRHCAWTMICAVNLRTYAPPW